MSSGSQPASPSLPWRIGSTALMSVTGLISRAFLIGPCRTDVQGLGEFVELLDKRRDVEGRTRGLVTVSNHTSILDDPVIWGPLPSRFLFSPDNLRWSLGSHDICFKTKPLSTFFTLGQVLPTHRRNYSEYAGLFQPTMTECIRLLSSVSPQDSTQASAERAVGKPRPADAGDPFTDAQLTYTTTGLDSYPSPSAYKSRRHGWVHIFPEGKVHQKSDKTMRYFKWGVSRLILEAEPLPQIVPMWIEGLDEVMHESRAAPRFIPRLSNNIKIIFGSEVDAEERFGDLRTRWQELKKKEEQATTAGKGLSPSTLTDELKYGQEAVGLRIECTNRVREEVLKVRRRAGLPDEDPKAGLVETWREEGSQREGKMKDGSWVKDL